MNTYDITSKLIGNTIKEPLFIRDITTEQKKGLTDKQLLDLSYKDLGFGHKSYYNTYILTRNFMYLISYFETYTQHPSYNSIQEGLSFLKNTFNYNFSTDFMVSPLDARSWEKAKHIMIKETLGFLRLYYDAYLDTNHYRDMANDTMLLIGRAVTWDQIISMLSKHPCAGLNLFTIISIIKNAFFVNYQYEHKGSYFEKELETSMVIAIMYTTGHISNIRVFKNGKK